MKIWEIEENGLRRQTQKNEMVSLTHIGILELRRVELKDVYLTIQRNPFKGT